MQSCADPVQGLHGRLARTSGRKWRIRAAPIRPKLTRGMTNASSIAVAKLPRTTSDRRLAIRRIRADTCVSSARANSWYSKTLGSGDANEKAPLNLRGRSSGLIAALRRSTGKDDPFFPARRCRGVQTRYSWRQNPIFRYGPLCVGKPCGPMRALADGVPFEFEPSRQQDPHPAMATIVYDLHHKHGVMEISYAPPRLRVAGQCCNGIDPSSLRNWRTHWMLWRMALQASHMISRLEASDLLQTSSADGDFRETVAMFTSWQLETCLTLSRRDRASGNLIEQQYLTG
jgi:hypothetical protein